MNIHGKNLLPRMVVEGVAPNQQLSNIKPKVTLRRLGLQRLKFSRVILAAFAVLFLSGYVPVLDIPPIRKSQALAENIQTQQIEKSALPKPMHLPHPGYLSTRFSFYHPGLDIATGLGMPVKPIADGAVEEVNYGFLGFGNNVVINHGQGYKSLYAHMGKVYAKKDQLVTSENIIGEVGLTGHTSGPHTHLEVTKDGSFIDPQTILPDISPLPEVASR